MQVITLSKAQYNDALTQRRLTVPPFTLCQGASLKLVCAVTGRCIEAAAVGGRLEHRTFGGGRPLMRVDLQFIAGSNQF